MYIKELTIQGFKSYKDKTVIGPFHQGHNVVVGRNGSGKSNFFAAIEFVLSNEYSNLKVEQRCSLLHEGTGPRPINAFVEILIDNSERRFPIEADEVVIKRCIGPKKDQYYINNKLATSKTEVFGLLETAGFSCSNPYYIVKQGQINAIACSSDKERLMIVREVAGTEVYTDKRKSAEVELASSDKVIGKVKEGIESLSLKLEQLGEERKVMEEFSKLEAKKKVLEFAITEKDVKECQLKLNTLEADLMDCQEENDDEVKEYEDFKESLNKIRLKITGLKSREHAYLSELKELESTNEKLLKERDALSFKIEDAQQSQVRQKDISNQINELKSLLDEAQNDKRSSNSELKLLNEEMIELDGRMSFLEQERNHLFAKKGRREQFGSVKKRNEWLNSEIESLLAISEQKDVQIQNLEAELKSHSDLLSEMCERIAINEDKYNDLESTREKVQNLISECDIVINKFNKSRCEKSLSLFRLRQSESELCETVDNLKYRLKCIPSMKSVLVGISSVLEVINSNPMWEDAYYGMIIDQFSCQEQMYAAVETTAGMKLFNHLVRDDCIATDIIAELNRRKLPGTFEFKPLNRIMFKEFNYSQVSLYDAFPMIEKLEFDPDMLKVMSSVFGKTIVCRNMDTVVKVTQNCRFDCVTLDGEKGSSNGVLSGGYFSQERSKLTNYHRYQDAIDKLEGVQTKINHAQDEITVDESGVLDKSNEKESHKEKILHLRTNLSDLTVELRTSRVRKEALVELCTENEHLLAKLKAEKTNLQANVGEFQNELMEDINSQLSEEEKCKNELTIKEIDNLKMNRKQLFKRLDDKKKKLCRVEAEMIEFDKEKKLAVVELEKMTTRQCETDGYIRKLEDLNQQLELLDRNMAVLKNQNYELNLRLQKMSDEESVAEEELSKLENNLANASKKKEKLFEKKVQLMERLKKQTSKLNDLGGVHPRLLEMCADSTMKMLSKELTEVHKKLKEFDDVNMKSLEQFTTFSEEKENLKTRHEQLVEDKARIIHLINVLDNKRSDQILYTYKQVHKNFKAVFQRLVPQGQGTLVLCGTAENISLAEKMENATGIAISVSFTGNGNMKSMNMLSGGQKSIVALALILSIQECDPAPFYLFDEVDAAMDIEHRQAIASIIHSQAENAQFITTTFRPELLANADRYFGVFFRGKCSHVEEVGKDEAHDFVEESVIQQ